MRCVPSLSACLATLFLIVSTGCVHRIAVAPPIPSPEGVTLNALEADVTYRPGDYVVYEITTGADLDENLYARLTLLSSDVQVMTAKVERAGSQGPVVHDIFFVPTHVALASATGESVESSQPVLVPVAGFRSAPYRACVMNPKSGELLAAEAACCFTQLLSNLQQDETMKRTLQRLVGVPAPSGVIESNRPLPELQVDYDLSNAEAAEARLDGIETPLRAYNVAVTFSLGSTPVMTGTLTCAEVPAPLHASLGFVRFEGKTMAGAPLSVQLIGAGRSSLTTQLR